MTALRSVAVWCFALALFIVMTLPDVVQGQVARSPSEIPAQLRTGAQFMRKALENLGDTEQAKAYIFQAYVQLRDVQAKMQNANGVPGFPIPLYTIALPQVIHAKSRTQEALTCLQYPSEKGGAPEASVRLGEALNVTETLLLTLF
jgi:hypothetical protein